jgi:hypothetical protein
VAKNLRKSKKSALSACFFGGKQPQISQKKIVSTEKVCTFVLDILKG